MVKIKAIKLGCKNMLSFAECVIILKPRLFLPKLYYYWITHQLIQPRGYKVSLCVVYLIKNSNKNRTDNR